MGQLAYGMNWIGEHWHQATIWMMDFEGSYQSGVVEYGVVCMQGGVVRGAYDGRCAPEGRILEREAAVHGLRESALAGERPFREEFARFAELRRRGIFAAHNRAAENTFLRRVWALPGEVPDFGGGVLRTWGPWIDTLGLYRRVYPQIGGYGLGQLIETFGCGARHAALAKEWCCEARRKPHCALYDALGSAVLLERLGQETGFDNVSLGWLIRNSVAGLKSENLVLDL